MGDSQRTYIYYSDDKIRDYQQQVTPSKWKSALRRLEQLEAKVLGSGGTLKFGPPASDPILRSMQTMFSDLANQGLVGTFDEPRRYFHGTLEFHYGFFNLVNPPVIFLVGATDRTLVALGGSQKHVRGFRDRKEIPVADGARAVVMEPDVATLIYASEASPPGLPPEEPPLARGEDIRARHVAGMYKNWKSRGEKMEFEVLARKELVSPVSAPYTESPMNVLIGSPVFIAQ